MTKTIKRPIAFFSAVVMFMVMLLYFPSGTFSSLDWELKARAVNMTEPSKNEKGEYQIGTAAELYWFANHVNSGNTSANAVLTANITVNTGVLDENGNLVSYTSGFTSWTPIGNYFSQYNGTFNGQNHTVSGLYFNDKNQICFGLFGGVGTSGKVLNVGVVDSYFNLVNNLGYPSYGGGVCGANFGGTIENCYNKGTVKATSTVVKTDSNLNGIYVGGVCGGNQGTIKDCFNTGVVEATGASNVSIGSSDSSNISIGSSDSSNVSISSSDSYLYNIYVGGICGGNQYGIIENCRNDGIANGTPNDVDSYIGGVCGGNLSGTIKNCSNTSTISCSGSNVGGVCGMSNQGTITDCSNTGTISGNNNVGGVCGYNYNDSGTATIENCSNTGTISGNDNVGGVCGDNFEGTITNCYNTGSVSGSNNSDSNGSVYVNVGGVCGDNIEGTITNCYNTGSVSGSNNSDSNDGVYVYVGGVCGDNFEGTITNCYNTGTVSASNLNYGSEPVIYVGGVCGYSISISTITISTITNCYYNNEEYVGNAVGYNYRGTVSDNVLDKTTEQFNSGEVAYLLQSGQTADVSGNIPEVWGQTIDTDPYPVLDSTKKVYQVNKYDSCTENSNIESIVYSNTNEAIYTHEYSSGGICINCDALENGKDGFKSASLTLTDGVIINYYMILSEDALADTDAYIHFTSEQGLDKTIMLSNRVDDNGKYKFSLELRPDKMADVITAQVVYGDGSQGSSVEYSVKQYADNVTESDSSRELVDAMLKYGAFTQLYTNENTDNLATSVQDYTTNANISNDYNHKLDSKASGISVKSATLQIGAYTTIKVKYQLDDGANIENYTFKCGDTVLEPEKSGDYYYVYLRNISPQNLDEMYSFTVSDGTDTTTLEYSAFTYMKNVLDNATTDNQKLVNLINAMYYYNKAAEAYLTTINYN